MGTRKAETDRGLSLVVGGLVALSAILYLGLAVLAHLHRYFTFDLAITLWLQALRNRPMDVFLAAVSWPGYSPEFVPFFVFALVILWRLRLRAEMLIMSIAELGVGAMGFIVKPIVGRPRPSTGLVWVNDYRPEDPYSFTAGHVHTFMVIAGFIVYLALTRMAPGARRRALVAACVVFMLVEGFARVYLGDHWLSDVVGAYFAGGIWLGLAILADQYWLSRRGARGRPRAA